MAENKVNIFDTTHIYGDFYNDKEKGDTMKPDSTEEAEYQLLLSKAVGGCLSIKTKKRLLELTKKKEGR